ncbi:MAG: double-strand break repair protein AddB [Alphaproteobacteria bacterium]|nr:double-strand break repair protein AddB [Alphaproteobacteria bacterium]
MRRINLYTIPAGAAFADELARGFLKRFSKPDDPFAISRALILLPTRRAIRTLGEAFARVTPGGVAVLPRMRALGDFDDAPSLLEDDSDDATRELAPDLPPPLSPLRRELLLAKLIQQWSLNLAKEEDARTLGAATPAHAVKLARELAALLDQATAEGLAWERLQTLVPHELARHWEKTLTFLSILSEAWPKLLISEGASDPATHRDMALRRAAERWKSAPPDFPVVAAGSTGSVPATAELLRAIAYLSNGAVVLPGVDLELDREAWEAAESGHPQHGMRQLLAKMDATRGDVEPWVDGLAVARARSRLIAEALRPAATTPAWRDLVAERRGVIEDGLRGLSILHARTASEEALAIACALRAAIETPGKTAALVTPDRTLARRVAGELKRWGIAIDDSGGTPLAHTVPGRFLCLLADAAAEEFAPVPLLALLKHPLTVLAFAERSEARALAVELEEHVLRGLRPPAGIAGLRKVLDPKSACLKLVEQLELACGAFAAAMASGEHDATVLVRLHREAAEMASSIAKSTALPLWEREAGEAALALFEQLAEAAADVGLTMDGTSYAAFIRTVMDAVPVRPNVGQHPRLSILGPLEVRLQHADLMILGGLNEGVWPPATDPGPWLNRPMRRELDMSQPERRVGLSAHDFAQAAACAEVLLTRSEKDAGAPTTPSRWLTRLSILVDGAGLGERLRDHQWLAIARGLDLPLLPPKPVEPPEPRPPVAARPRELPVTQIELWVRDPYALYARQILKLKPLDPIDMMPAASDRGNVIHDALEAFVKTYPKDLPPEDEALRALMRCGEEAFGMLLTRPGVQGFWWPRYERIARWFLGLERGRRANALQVLAEQRGAITFAAPFGPFKLSAKADRIELLADHTIAIADYKTGTVPTTKQVQTGLSPQLTLEAAIALEGGFAGISAASVTELVYIGLKGASVAGQEIIVDFDGETPDQAAARAKAGLMKFVAAYDSPEMAYLSKPRVLLERHAGDYDHLARVKEWSSGEDDE